MSSNSLVFGTSNTLVPTGGGDGQWYQVKNFTVLSAKLCTSRDSLTALYKCLAKFVNGTPINSQLRIPDNVEISSSWLRSKVNVNLKTLKSSNIIDIPRSGFNECSGFFEFTQLWCYEVPSFDKKHIEPKFALHFSSLLESMIVEQTEEFGALVLAQQQKEARADVVSFEKFQTASTKYQNLVEINSTLSEEVKVPKNELFIDTATEMYGRIFTPNTNDNNTNPDYPMFAFRTRFHQFFRRLDMEMGGNLFPRLQRYYFRLENKFVFVYFTNDEQLAKVAMEEFGFQRLLTQNGSMLYLVGNIDIKMFVSPADYASIHARAMNLQWTNDHPEGETLSRQFNEHTRIIVNDITQYPTLSRAQLQPPEQLSITESMPSLESEPAEQHVIVKPQADQLVAVKRRQHPTEKQEVSLIVAEGREKRRDRVSNLRKETVELKYALARQRAPNME